MINLHPGLTFIRRQHWYLIKIVTKYVIKHTGLKIPFTGHPGATTEKLTYTVPNFSLPKDLQQKEYIVHGKNESYDM